MDVDKLIAIIGIVIAILGVVDSGLQRYAKANTSKYAAQRDFEHLRRNQDQLKQSIAVILEENDKLNEEMIRMRTQLDTLIVMQSRKECE